MRGISVWLFSKIVMLIFVLVVFASVLSFYKSVQQREAISGAYAIIEEIRSKIEGAYSGPTSYEGYVPLPEALPMGGGKYSKTYSVLVKCDQNGCDIGVMLKELNKRCEEIVKSETFIAAGHVSLPVNSFCTYIKKSECAYITIKKGVDGKLNVSCGG